MRYILSLSMLTMLFYMFFNGFMGLFGGFLRFFIGIKGGFWVLVGDLAPWLYNRHFDRRRPCFGNTQLFSRYIRQVNHATWLKRPTIVHFNNDMATIFK